MPVMFMSVRSLCRYNLWSTRNQLENKTNILKIDSLIFYIKELERYRINFLKNFSKATNIFFCKSAFHNRFFSCT